ncbi:hypothetical protein HMPREF3182_00416 [Megasphaera hutchinsoni]|uniref:Uncharacterized protein n=1 Tax=Megasphaera hutchinsoni TaxID=1588748 RepID=A0A134CJN2_9FIRM|nr:hypothetical protein HMPREF3182_00416 [Megasphaera hutchinsoni]
MRGEAGDVRSCTISFRVDLQLEIRKKLSTLIALFFMLSVGQLMRLFLSSDWRLVIV